MGLLIGLRELEVGLAGRAMVLPGRREGELVVQVPGEWPVLNYYLEGEGGPGGSLNVTSAYREDVYGTYEMSLSAVAAWLRGLGVEVRWA